VFAEEVVLGDLDRAWQELKLWQSEWLSRQPGLTEQQRIGMSYCFATQCVYEWLSEWFIDRNKGMNCAALLTPKDRVMREAGAKAYAELLYKWLNSAERTTSTDEAFAGARVKVVDAIAVIPPYEVLGCRECPARCRVLPLSAMLSAQLSREMSLLNHESVEQWIGRLQPREDQKYPPALERRKPDAALLIQAAYCAVARSDTPGLRDERRTDVLKSLATLARKRTSALATSEEASGSK
jgi:hypothetical protein